MKDHHSMRSVNKAVSRKKSIAKFRVMVASVIIGNPTDTAHHTRDIQDIPHIAELCDQYTLMLVSNWLATKYGFPIYRSSIEQDQSSDLFRLLPLLSCPSLANRYPFCSYEERILSGQSIAHLFSYLDEHFLINLELIGDVYQHVISQGLAITESKVLGIDSDADQRNCGEFYTAPWVADKAFDLWADSEGLDIGFYAQRQLSVMDPSCGCGNFLLAALRKVRSLSNSTNELVEFARESLFGIDIDGRAIELCKAAVLIYLSDYFRGDKKSQHSAKPDLAKELDGVLQSLDCHIRMGNAILDSLCADQQGKIDLLITNPPYISFGSRDQGAIGSGWQKLLKKRFPASSEYKIRYTSIFQEIGLELIRDGGQSIFFVPDAFLTGGYYQKLRKHILEHAEIVSLSEMHEKTIAGVTVGRWCLAQYRKVDSSPSTEVKSSKDEIKPEEIKLYSYPDPDSKSKAIEFHLSPQILVSKDKMRFQLLFSEFDRDIVHRCRELPALSSVLHGHTGIRARKGQASIVSKHQDSINHQPGIISGAELNPFQIKWAGNFIEIAPAKLFAGGFDPQIIKNPKILLRQTGDSLIAAVDESNLYHLNNVHSFAAVDLEFTGGKAYKLEKLYFLAGLLNSKFYRYLYRLKTREFKKALAQIDIETVENMPFPDLGCADWKKLGGKLYSDLASTSRQDADLLVYDLFRLSEEEIAHIEGSGIAN